MHMENPKVFSGSIDMETADIIAGLVRDTASRTMLDYGSGKGYQYLVARVHERWGILPTCYDPGVRQLARKPCGIFDAVICTDVLEHVPEEDALEVLEHIFSYAGRFAYLGICCRPAGKVLPDGQNAHATIKPPVWWEERIALVKPDRLKVWTDYEYFSDYDVQRERLDRLRATYGADVPEALAEGRDADGLHRRV